MSSGGWARTAGRRRLLARLAVARRVIAQTISRTAVVMVFQAMGVTCQGSSDPHERTEREDDQDLFWEALRTLADTHTHRAVSPEWARAGYRRLPDFHLAHHMALYTRTLALADHRPRRSAPEA
ncbi:hypothetical protein ACIQBJ_29050 [Kitasatospora sp. NPDC088391]|uniref:hypothetical protein n=1 Tax=Kitasatospora sp. NPDC088391 TaxID=3364074 RepID=UPI00382BEA10